MFRGNSQQMQRVARRIHPKSSGYKVSMRTRTGGVYSPALTHQHQHHHAQYILDHHVRSFSLLLPPTPSSENNKSNNNDKPKVKSTTSILPTGDNPILDSPVSEKGREKGRRRDNTSVNSSDPKKSAGRKRRESITATAATTTTKRRTKSSLRSRKSTRAPLDLNPAVIEKKLQQWYQHHGNGKEFTDKCLKLNLIRLEDGLNMWKGTFQCPLTNETFECGTLKGLPEEKNFIKVKGAVMYYKMARARTSCIARALDCLQYRQDQTYAKGRICVEMPYMSPKYDPALAPSLEDKEEDEISEEDDDSDESTDNGSDSEFFSDEDDEEEYTIQFVPGASSNDNTQHGANNPLARVIGGWSPAATVLRNIKEMDSIPSVMASNPEDELHKLIENAYDWIEQEQNDSDKKRDSAHRVMLHFSRTLDVGNTILQGLAKANRRVKFTDKLRGVEPIATKILNYLWTTKSDHPNADTYIAYLGCLEGATPEIIAERAKFLLNAMNEGAAVGLTGKTYPKPTIGVVNAVVQLCAQVGGESGRYYLKGIEDPNRETFLSLLSSMSYPPSIEGEVGGFDPIFAQECIDKMKSLATAKPSDASLSPDIDIYNAGLRWSGGVWSTLSRPYMRPVPWDSYAEIFEHGFQLFDEDSTNVQNAYRMHAWMEDMTGHGEALTPNIETYEAVIQAYVRTGTLEGLRQAETLLDSLLNNSQLKMTVRMQTFHPIIAAWAHSGHVLGPQKVNKWVNLLESLSEDQGRSSQLDGRMSEAPLLASATRLIRSLDQQKEFSFTEKDELIDTAHGCTVHLQNLCAGLTNGSPAEQPSTLLDAKMFVLVLNVWGKLGLHFLKENDPRAESAKEALGKMNETLEEFEKLISLLQPTKSSDPIKEEQLLHLTGNAHKVYSTYFTLLKDAIAVPQPTDSAWLLDNHIHHIERWVRRINEFCVLNDGKEKSLNGGELLYSDMFAYIASGTLPRGCSETRAEFLVEILKYLNSDDAEILPSQRRGDIVRLCFMSVDLLSMQNHESSLTSTYKETVEVISRLAEGQQEKEALLGRYLGQIESLRETRPLFPVDYDAVIKDLRKHSSGGGFANARHSRSRPRHRTPRRAVGPSRSSSRTKSMKRTATAESA